MESEKPWYKSKTVWTDVATALFTGYISLSTQNPGQYPPLPAWVIGVVGPLLGFGGIAGRLSANASLTK